MTTITATSRCQWCEYSAQMSGDDAIEIGRFLRALLIEHCETVHPERFAPASAPPSTPDQETT